MTIVLTKIIELRKLKRTELYSALRNSGFDPEYAVSGAWYFDNSQPIKCWERYYSIILVNAINVKHRYILDDHLKELFQKLLDYNRTHKISHSLVPNLKGVKNLK